MPGYIPHHDRVFTCPVDSVYLLGDGNCPKRQELFCVFISVENGGYIRFSGIFPGNLKSIRFWILFTERLNKEGYLFYNGITTSVSDKSSVNIVATKSIDYFKLVSELLKSGVLFSDHNRYLLGKFRGNKAPLMLTEKEWEQTKVSWCLMSHNGVFSIECQDMC